MNKKNKKSWVSMWECILALWKRNRKMENKWIVEGKWRQYYYRFQSII